MTPEHLLFIPAIFLIGFAAGSMLTPYTIALSQKRQLGQHTTERQKAQLNRVSGRTVLCTLLGFVVVFAATHLFSLPNTMASLGEMTGGLPLFDQRASFSAEEVYNRLTQFGLKARMIYLRFTYTADLVFPLSFLLFLSSLAAYVGERSAISQRFRYLMIALPAVWFLSDMLENTMTFALITQFPRPTNVIGGLIGYVTVAKFSLLFMALLLPLAVFSLYQRRDGSEAVNGPTI
jgi:hypothetical protein